MQRHDTYRPRETLRSLPTGPSSTYFCRSHCIDYDAPHDCAVASRGPDSQPESNMNAKDVLKLSIDMGRMVSLPYVEDLTDAELLKRPHPKCNHIKWQLGHLIAGENQMIEQIAPGSMPALPAGFAERYTKETASSDDPAKFDSKADLLTTF